MTPLSTESLVLMGFAAGSLGGLVAAINAVFGHFRKLPVRPMSVSKAAVRHRATFVTFRVIVGAILGAAITFWFVPDVIDRTLAIPKLVFIQFAFGLAGSLLAKFPSRNHDAG